MGKGAGMDNTLEAFIEIKDYREIAQSCFIPQGLQVPEPQAVFSFNGVDVFTKKSISTIIAKAKAGKTTLAAWIVAQMVRRGIRTLWIDTEQGLYYASRTQHWTLKIAGQIQNDDLQFYDLKIHPPDERIKIIEALIYSGGYDVTVIDGIRDLVFDINAPEEATLIATHLMRWAEVHNCHIITILHQNKGNEHARGHLGSELVNKSETVLKVSQNDEKEIIIEPEFTRGQPFEVFALDRDQDGIPLLIEGWKPEEERAGKKKPLLPVDITQETHNDIIKNVFSIEERLAYAGLMENIKHFFQVRGTTFGDSKAREFIAHYIQEKYIKINGAVKGYAKYEKCL